ncbi:DNA repair protein [Micromonospora sp. CA-263727]|uniref:DNA repair protein n=1 Tax=Micromonospora sp. CA-263727 TaxID=3239967 RepID=UPI003D90CC3F
MPNQPNDRYQQHIERTWLGRTTAGRFPVQPPYRGRRAHVGILSWRELNKLPAGHHLNPL